MPPPHAVEGWSPRRLRGAVYGCGGLIVLPLVGPAVALGAIFLGEAAGDLPRLLRGLAALTIVATIQLQWMLVARVVLRFGQRLEALLAAGPGDASSAGDLGRAAESAPPWVFGLACVELVCGVFLLPVLRGWMGLLAALAVVAPAALLCTGALWLRTCSRGLLHIAAVLDAVGQRRSDPPRALPSAFATRLRRRSLVAGLLLAGLCLIVALLLGVSGFAERARLGGGVALFETAPLTILAAGALVLLLLAGLLGDFFRRFGVVLAGLVERADGLARAPAGAPDYVQMRPDTESLVARAQLLPLLLSTGPLLVVASAIALVWLVDESACGGSMPVLVFSLVGLAAAVALRQLALGLLGLTRWQDSLLTAKELGMEDGEDVGNAEEAEEPRSPTPGTPP